MREWAASTTELLDDPRSDADDVVASLRDIARINRAFGSAAAAASRLGEQLASVPLGAEVTLLDIGTGAADIPRLVRRRAEKRGIRVTIIGLERIAAAAREAARGGDVLALIADGGRLPFADRSIDLVLCSKLLHHLPGEPGLVLIREMDRVARLGAVVSDIRRSPVAAAGIWLASFPMRFHPATRRDSVISVFRAFTPAELQRVCERAGVRARIKRHPGWSLTAAWCPNAARA